jgi:hypothetical protein
MSFKPPPYRGGFSLRVGPQAPPLKMPHKGAFLKIARAALHPDDSETRCWRNILLVGRVGCHVKHLGVAPV